MKIVQINAVYGAGSTGKIVYDLHNGFIKNGHESYVFFGRGKKSPDNNVIKFATELESKIHAIFSALTGDEYAFSLLSTNKLIKRLREIEPDCIIVHCLNAHYVNLYKLFEFFKSFGIQVYLVLHAEIMHTYACEHAENCEKWKTIGCEKCKKKQGIITRFFRDDSSFVFKKMKKAFEIPSLCIIGVSDYISSRAKQSIIFNNKQIVTIKNGIDTSCFQEVHNEVLEKKLCQLKFRHFILHVTPNFTYDVKGGKYLLELSKMMPDALFLVVGGGIKKKGLDNNVFYYGYTSDKKELASLYSFSDCLAMTSLCETYPTVCLEAVSCGCNVIGFDVGGVKETIPSGYGEVVEPYNLVSFKEAILRSFSQEKKQSFCVKNSNEFVNEYLALVYGMRK